MFSELHILHVPALTRVLGISSFRRAAKDALGNADLAPSPAT